MAQAISRYAAVLLPFVEFVCVARLWSAFSRHQHLAALTESVIEAQEGRLIISKSPQVQSTSYKTFPFKKIQKLLDMLLKCLFLLSHYTTSSQMIFWLSHRSVKSLSLSCHFLRVYILRMLHMHWCCLVNQCCKSGIILWIFAAPCCLTRVDEFCCQASHSESEQALQRRLEEVCEELRTTQSRNSSLQASLDKAQQDSSTHSGQRMGEQGPNGYHMLRHGA